MKDLKHKVIRGGLAKASAQGASLVVRMGSLMVLARMLGPKDFGLVGMVTAFTGVLNLFRDFGLSSATVQRGNVTDEQVSTLFWINILVGVILGGLLMGGARILAAFYHEPRLVWVAVILGSSFIFNAFGVQHTALLERQMRFTTLATIDIVCLIVSTVIGIVMAATGFGYWSLVATAVTLPLFTSVCLWFASGWKPGRPHLHEEVHSLLRFGGAFTLVNLIVYVAYNLEKVLLGRYWGAIALGLYGRAYQLINLPTENLNSAFWGIAFSGLSRVRHEPDRFRSYFLRGYSLVLGVTIPVTIAAALFARDLIFVLLGPKWNDVPTIFRMLAPTILVFALINPLAWLIFALGMMARSLKIVLVVAAVVIAGYLTGLSHGPKGVAIGYSVAMLLLAVPIAAWSVQGTAISLRDVFVTASRPLISGFFAAALALGLQFFFLQSLPPLAKLILEVAVLLGAYVAILFYGMGQKAIYWDLLQTLRKRAPSQEDTLVPA